MRLLTAGESHGEGIVAILDGVPAGLRIDFSFIKERLRERRRCYGRGERMKIEEDEFKVLSGVKRGFTIGSPICFLIENKEWEEFKPLFSPYPEQIDKEKVEEAQICVPTPGHADFCGWMKYKHSINLVRERASARETVARVAAGAIAELLLKELGVEFLNYTKSIKDIEAKIPQDPKLIKEASSSSPLLCPDKEAEGRMKDLIDRIREEGESVGGVFEVQVIGLVPGIGSYMQWGARLDARLVYAVFSIPAIKGVEIGEGFALSRMKGSAASDPILYEDGFKRASNKAGGIEGGLSNGEPIILKAAVKPPPTTRKGTPSIDLYTKKQKSSSYIRSDVCVVPACSVIARAMMALEIADATMEKFGHDTMEEIKGRYQDYKEYINRL
jgi:chorismate synthase